MERVDTVTIEEIHELTKFQLVIDSNRIDSLLTRFKELSKREGQTLNSDDLATIRASISSIWGELRKPIIKADTIEAEFPILIEMPDTNFSLIVKQTFFITPEGGIEHALEVPAFKIPYKKKVVTIDGNFKPNFWQKALMYWGAFATILLILALVIKLK